MFTFPYTALLRRCRFAVKKVVYTQDQHRIERKFIVLIDTKTRLVIKITDYADYVLYRVPRDRGIFQTSESMLLAVCQFLNYVFIDHYEKYRITQIYDISKKMIEDFLMDYARTPLIGRHDGKYPSKESVLAKRAGVCLFGEMLCHYHKDKMTHLKRRDLIHTHFTIKNDRKCSVAEYMVPVRWFDRNVDELDQLLRDMPIDLGARILDAAEVYDPELCFPISLGLYAGLREGEVCNVRRKDSLYGPGVILQTLRHEDAAGNVVLKPVSMEIDLTKEVLLRSDGAFVGLVKKERMASVFGPFVDIIYHYYIKHLGLIKGKPCETTRPMFLNQRINKKTGVYMAMTRDNYEYRVKQLFWNCVVPSLKSDPDPDLQLYYYQLQNHTWGLHAFRHWFTVYLLYCGVDDSAELMHFRGDKNPRSAETYLKRKGVLMQTYARSVEKLGGVFHEWK